MHGQRDFAFGKNNAFERAKVGGDDSKWMFEVGELRVADGDLDASTHLFSADKTAAREEDGVKEMQEPPTSFNFPRKFFHARAVMAVGPDRADIRAHAGTGRAVNRNSVFLEHLDDADVSQSFRAAGRKCESDAW